MTDGALVPHFDSPNVTYRDEVTWSKSCGLLLAELASDHPTPGLVLFS